MNRRKFTGKALLGAAAAMVSPLVNSRVMDAKLPSTPSGHLLKPRKSVREPSTFTATLGVGQLSVLSDGNLQLPVSFLHPEGIDKTVLNEVLERYKLAGDAYRPDCNISVWQQGDRTVLFDVGAGSQFMGSAGHLPMGLEAAGIEPESVSDIVLTHAHPDHLWGLLDDFDDLLYTNATIHIHQDELDYWRADDTLGKTPEARQSFVVGAQSRLSRAEEQLSVFKGGDEVLPGIEAIDTHGHTPGHTSFALHQGGDSVLIVGDALNNVALSFEYPDLLSPVDQDPTLASRTRKALLDRIVTEQMRVVGFHLPTPGFGRVERKGSQAYQFMSEDTL